MGRGWTFWPERDEASRIIWCWCSYVLRFLSCSQHFRLLARRQQSARNKCIFVPDTPQTTEIRRKKVGATTAVGNPHKNWLTKYAYEPVVRKNVARLEYLCLSLCFSHEARCCTAPDPERKAAQTRTIDSKRWSLASFAASAATVAAGLFLVSRWAPVD